MSHEPLPVPPNIPQIMAALFKEVEFKILGGVDAARVAEAAYYEHLWREEASKYFPQYEDEEEDGPHEVCLKKAKLCAARCRALSATQTEGK